ncbi:MAG: hypothetical protein PHR16_09820 [Methylovulum sp.]|nr:hypothetical protein [Methylovulum sp.]
MVDFIAAFKEGLSAADIADKNKREIASVFEELNKQLTKETDGKVKISIRDSPMSALSLMTVQLSDLSDINKKNMPTNQIISALNPLAKSQENLAHWSQDRNGYPCKISYGNKEHYCEDKPALEESLAKLLQDPIVGESLYKLMHSSD